MYKKHMKPVLKMTRFCSPFIKVEVEMKETREKEETKKDDSKEDQKKKGCTYNSCSSSSSWSRQAGHRRSKLMITSLAAAVAELFQNSVLRNPNSIFIPQSTGPMSLSKI
ncbi:hypothetical protein WN943_005300 [Citrus x changshan-huyou]